MAMERDEEMLLVGVGAVVVVLGLAWIFSSSASGSGASAGGSSLPAITVPSSTPATFGGDVFNIGGGTPGAQIAAAAAPGPIGGSADGGVTPPCGCGGQPTTYYGTPAIQAQQLAQAIAQAMAGWQSSPQNLANVQGPPTNPATQQPSTVVQSFGVVAPAAWEQAFGTWNPFKLYAMQVANDLGVTPTQTFGLGGK